MNFKSIIKNVVSVGIITTILCTHSFINNFNVCAAEREIYPFQQIKQYNNNFSDVTTSDWFYNSVAQAYTYDLVNGRTDTKFDPKGNVTIAEVITMADKVHSYGIMGNLSHSIQMEADPWYTLFVRYAEVQQIISKGEFYGEYDRPATREELAHIFAHVFPDNGYQQINVVTKLPDIDFSNQYYNDVIKLYNAGVLSGNDYSGTFTPKSNITRAEAAAIASRLALPSNRIQLTFCQSIALPSKDNSFGELKKIGTEVISREERDRQRAQQQTTIANTTTNTTTTNTNNNSSSNSSTTSSSSSNTNNNKKKNKYNTSTAQKDALQEHFNTRLVFTTRTEDGNEPELHQYKNKDYREYKMGYIIVSIKSSATSSDLTLDDLDFSEINEYAEHDEEAYSYIEVGYNESKFVAVIPCFKYNNKTYTFPPSVFKSLKEDGFKDELIDHTTYGIKSIDLSKADNEIPNLDSSGSKNSAYFIVPLTGEILKTSHPDDAWNSRNLIIESQEPGGLAGHDIWKRKTEPFDFYFDQDLDKPFPYVF